MTKNIDSSKAKSATAEKSHNDPNDNYAMYERDRVAKHAAQSIPAEKIAHTPLIASIKVDKWLNELRQILVDRSEFKLADHVVSARVAIRMLEKQRAELLEACKQAQGYLELASEELGIGDDTAMLRTLRTVIARAEGK